MMQLELKQREQHFLWALMICLRQDELVESKVIMKKSGQPISERDLLNKLKSKLSLRVYEKIDQNNDMTFDNACEKIRSAIQTKKRMKDTFYSNSSSSTSTKRKFDNM
jgi:hypothetical protein